MFQAGVLPGARIEYRVSSIDVTGEGTIQRAAPGAIEPSLLTESAERALADAMGALSTEVESLFAGEDDIVINDWKELDRYLATTLSAMDGFVLIWVVIIFLALSFGLVNTLIMAVFERVREIGVMLALGMKPAAILWQIVIESMLVLALGVMVGKVLWWATVLTIRDGIDISIVSDGLEMWGMSNRLVPDLRLRDVALANSVVIVLGFLASILPAWRASHYEPVEAITKVE